MSSQRQLFKVARCRCETPPAPLQPCKQTQQNISTSCFGVSGGNCLVLSFLRINLNPEFTRVVTKSGQSWNVTFCFGTSARRRSLGEFNGCGRGPRDPEAWDRWRVWALGPLLMSGSCQTLTDTRTRVRLLHLSQELLSEWAPGHAHILTDRCFELVWGKRL